MKEEYISFEQAVKLKELGFDWETYDYYYGKDRKFHQSIPLDHNGNDGGRKECCSAPTLAFAQKWLREKHCLSVEPICNMVRQWNVNVCEIDNFGIAVYSKMNLETYESALSAGIDAALRLLTDKLNSLHDKE